MGERPAERDRGTGGWGAGQLKPRAGAAAGVLCWAHWGRPPLHSRAARPSRLPSSSSAVRPLARRAAQLPPAPTAPCACTRARWPASALESRSALRNAIWRQGALCGGGPRGNGCGRRPTGGKWPARGGQSLPCAGLSTPPRPIAPCPTPPTGLPGSPSCSPTRPGRAHAARPLWRRAILIHTRASCFIHSRPACRAPRPPWQQHCPSPRSAVRCYRVVLGAMWPLLLPKTGRARTGLLRAQRLPEKTIQQIRYSACRRPPRRAVLRTPPAPMRASRSCYPKACRS